MIGYDSRCRDLAEVFLSDDVIAHNHGERIDELAALIQTTVEDWLNANPSYPSSERHEAALKGGGVMAITPEFKEASSRAAIRALRGLEQTAIMLEKWGPEAFPANEQGRGRRDCTHGAPLEHH